MKSKNDFANFTAYLKLFSMGVRHSDFQKYLIHDSESIEQFTKNLVELGLVQEDRKISQFGKDMLKKISREKFNRSVKTAKSLPIYIPNKINKISRGDQ